MRFTTIVLIALIAFSAVANGANIAPAKRRLALPAWAKNSLKATANLATDIIIQCIADQIKYMAFGDLEKLPGMKYVAGHVVGKGIDFLANELKTVINKAVNGAIDKLRRRLRQRRRLWWDPMAAVSGAVSGAANAVGNAANAVGSAANNAVNAVGTAANNAVNAVGNAVHSAADAVQNAANGVGDAVQNAAAFVKNGVVDTVNATKAYAAAAARVASDVGAKIREQGIALDKMTGGNLSNILKKVVCPLLSEATKYAVTYALMAVGWPFGLPACLFEAVASGCRQAIDAAMVARRARRLRGHWSRHHRVLAKHRKLRHRKLRGHWSRHHRVLAKERKLRGHWSRHHRVLAKERKLRGHWSRHHRVLAKHRKLRHRK